MTYLRILLLPLLSISIAQGVAHAEGDISGVQRDAGELARLKGISTSEAVRRINLQNKFNNYLQNLDERSFISGDIESIANVFKLHVRVSREGIGKLLTSPMMTDPLLSQALQVETAPFTPGQLQAAKTAILPLLKFQDAATRVDARTGKLIIQVRNTLSVSRMIFQLGLSNFIDVEQRDKFPIPVADLGGFWGGGLSNVRTDDGSSCTTGFTVKRYGVRQLLTAGHCVLPSMNAPFVAKSVLVDTNINMTYQDAVWSGSSDFGWLYTSTTSPSNKIFDGAGERTMTGGFYTAGSSTRVANGTLLCKYGRNSGYTCAEVTNNAYTGVDAAGNNIGPLVQLGGTAENIAKCGDSGGPVFSGTIGYGIVSRGDVNGRCAGGSILLYAPLTSYTEISV